MTGWTQFTARFEEASDASRLIQSAEESEHRVHYAKSINTIARVRVVGYHGREKARELLKSAGRIEAVLIATFDDTTDSGSIDLYQPQNETGWSRVDGDTCPDANRWDFRFESSGLVETGVRAGQDFTLEEQYKE